MSIEQNPDQRHQSKDIAETTHDLKALHAQPAVIPDKEHRDDKGNKLGWKKPAAALALLGAVAAGAFGAGKVSSGDQSPTAERTPAATSTPNPGGPSNGPSGHESQAAPEVETPSDTIGYPVEQYTDGASLVNAFNDDQNAWAIAGGTPEEQKKIDWGNLDASIQSIASQYDKPYVDGIFVSNYSSNPALTAEVEDYERVHKGVLRARFGTMNSGEPADVEPYEQTSTVNNVVVEEQSAKKMVVSYTYTYSSNNDKNRADVFVEDINGKTGGKTQTWVVEDGEWKLAKEVTYYG